MPKGSRSADQPGKLKKESRIDPRAAERMALKWEAARKLDLITKVEELGWGGLSSKETGAIGAVVSQMARERGLVEKKTQTAASKE
ncbi:MAG: spore protein [Sulfobacillus thermosulfidooxidans]|nr:MAG: spore protein [Sulfobacillus thermosulfidooxidans]